MFLATTTSITLFKYAISFPHQYFLKLISTMTDPNSRECYVVTCTKTLKALTYCSVKEFGKASRDNSAHLIKISMVSI